MSPNDMPPQNTKTSRFSGIGYLLLLALLLIIGVGGFIFGRATAPSATNPPANETSSLEQPAQGAADGSAANLIADSEPIVLPEEPTAAPPTTIPTATPTPIPVIPTDLPTLAPPATPTAEPVQPPMVLPSGSPIEIDNLATLFEVWDLIADAYDGDLPPVEELVESAIIGSLDTLNDPYTRYVSPDVAARMREDMQGAVEGIGAFVRENDEGQFEIVRPIDGQPADIAGLKPGDVLIAVDGQSVLDLTFDEVILMVRGPKDSVVNLTIVREGEEQPLLFTIIRTRFEVPVIEYEMLPEDVTAGAAVAYIRLTEFNRNAEERLLEALDALLAQDPVGLVFDLRDNPGGFLDQSVAVADAFLPEGVVLFERNIRGLDETFFTYDGDSAESIPLVVLVNAGSASASEIVAGAIQDRGRAVLIGETTFGKGSVQQVIPLSDGSELRVTIARWYTPDNNTIDGEGIVPDFEVESPEDLGGVEDGQLMRAVEYILTGQ